MGARHQGKNKPRHHTHPVKPTDRTPRVRVRPDDSSQATESTMAAETMAVTAKPSGQSEAPSA